MPAALQLPEDSPALRTQWANLTPIERGKLLAELVVANPDLQLTGDVDFESDREPLFEEPGGGGFLYSLSGQVVGNAPAGSAAENKITTAQAVGIPVGAFAVAMMAAIGGAIVLGIFK
ncbi:MAG: hypothetical protein MI806_34205 [Minwuiales bacterium]|nr:hypothetical protein [Minwuiales bacterium]